MSEVATSPVSAVIPPRLEAVACSRDHWNDPYPENGRCTTCGVYLPSNPDALTAETAKDLQVRRRIGTKAQEEIAHDVLVDEGVEWDDAPEGMRQLALLFAKTKNVKTYELILQQIGVLKARPKPGETAVEVKHELSLTAGNVGDLKRSLSDLQDVLRIAEAEKDTM